MLHAHHLLPHLSPRLPVSRLRGHHPPRFIPFTSTSFLATARALPDSAASPPSPPADSGDEGSGPIEILPSSRSPIFAVDDNPSPLQISTSLLLTGAVSVFLFRSLRRRAKRAKDLRVRSDGLKKANGIKEEALDSLKAMREASIDPGAPPSAVQALLGGIAAGAIALILYKFTTTIEAALNRQTISDNFSVRQMTITIRTIVNGICYLATFVFGINSIGLILYSIQLAFGSFTDNPSSKPVSSSTKDAGQLNTAAPTESSSSNVESSSSDLQQTSDKSKS
ncbi:uncharacterized protein [Typha latifolia]|uniref:uncharacterized protein n=1 Tax=Typha latifolia TaxID=4733 RepID=UPI003C2AF42C